MIAGLAYIDKYLLPKKLQEVKADLLTELEKIKSIYSKEQFIHRLQFEKEFKIYLELWEQLIDLKTDTEILIPIGGIFDPNEVEGLEDEKRIKKIQESYRQVSKTIRYNKPFYGEEVYISVEQITNESFGQLLQKVRPFKSRTDPYIEVEERLKRIGKAIYEVERAIRSRIQNMGKSKLVG